MVHSSESRIIVAKGRLGPGEMMAVDLRREGTLYGDAEIKAKLAAEEPYGEWLGNLTQLDTPDPDRRARPGRVDRRSAAPPPGLRPAIRWKTSS